MDGRERLETIQWWASLAGAAVRVAVQPAHADLVDDSCCVRTSWGSIHNAPCAIRAAIEEPKSGIGTGELRDTNAGAFAAWIPANVSLRARAAVTAGLANDVEDVNQ